MQSKVNLVGHGAWNQYLVNFQRSKGDETVPKIQVWVLETWLRVLEQTKGIWTKMQAKQSLRPSKTKLVGHAGLRPIVNQLSRVKWRENLPQSSKISSRKIPRSFKAIEDHLDLNLTQNSPMKKCSDMGFKVHIWPIFRSQRMVRSSSNIKKKYYKDFQIFKAIGGHMNMKSGKFHVLHPCPTSSYLAKHGHLVSWFPLISNSNL